MDVLHTERLRLRWFDEADAPAVLELINQREWIENIRDAGVRDLAQARAWIESRLVAPCWTQGYGFWAIERLADGVLVGLCGLIHRATLPHPDVGYALFNRHTGCGYAREAAAACLRYAHEVLGMDRVLAITSPSNTRSAAVLRAIGLVPVECRVLEGADQPSQIHEWRSDAPVPDDAAQIDALVARFLGAFDNRGGAIARVAALPHWMLPAATVTVDGQTTHVRGFVQPRAELLQQGRLREFHEWEVAHETRIEGGMAQRWLRYAKRGLLDGEPFEGGGTKALQLVKTASGWKIAALAWQDGAPPAGGGPSVRS